MSERGKGQDDRRIRRNSSDAPSSVAVRPSSIAATFSNDSSARNYRLIGQRDVLIGHFRERQLEPGWSLQVLYLSGQGK